MNDVEEIAVLLQIGATVAALWALLCRMNVMTLDTLPAVRHQHGTLFAGLCFSLVLPGHAGHAALALGVLGFLVFSTHRWRFSAPEDVSSSRPVPLDELNEDQLETLWRRGQGR